MTEDSSIWALRREQIPACRKWAYLDNAAVAPLSLPARQALDRWADEALHEGDTVWARWADEVEQTRQRAAELINAGHDEIAFVANTTMGIHLIAEGFPWRAGDNVVVPANEFPSNIYPWMNLQDRQVATRLVPVPDGRIEPEDLVEACDARTRMIAVSWVGYATGWRIDVGRLVRLAHQRGIYVFLDAIQGLGVFPLDVRATGVDFLAADGHKWLLGPEGAGLLYVHREQLGRLRALNVGWHSVVDAHDFDHIELRLRPDAARYEGGSQNMAGVLALGASLQMLADWGWNATSTEVADRVLALTDEACRRLAEAGARIHSQRIGENRSGIVSFDVPGTDPVSIRQRCLRAGVALSCRSNRLRISPHAYASLADLDRLIDVLTG